MLADRIDDLLTERAGTRTGSAGGEGGGQTAREQVTALLYNALTHQNELAKFAQRNDV